MASKSKIGGGLGIGGEALMLLHPEYRIIAWVMLISGALLLISGLYEWIQEKEFSLVNLWGKIPLWKASEKARNALLKHEIHKHAKAYEEQTDQNQYDWYANYLVTEVPVYAKKPPYNEFVLVNPPMIPYDGGRRLGNVGGETVYDNPLIQRKSLREFIRGKKDGNR